MMVASHPPPSSPHSRTLAKYVCGLLGLACREAYLLTAETPNGYDDGHIACEVQIGGIWKRFDVAGDRYFTHMGAHLSLQDIIDNGFGLIEALAPTEPTMTPAATTSGIPASTCAPTTACGTRAPRSAAISISTIDGEP